MRTEFFLCSKSQIKSLSSLCFLLASHMPGTLTLRASTLAIPLPGWSAPDSLMSNSFPLKSLLECHLLIDLCWSHLPRGLTAPLSLRDIIYLSRDWTCVSCVSCTAGGFFTAWAIREALFYIIYLLGLLCIVCLLQLNINSMPSGISILFIECVTQRRHSLDLWWINEWVNDEFMADKCLIKICYQRDIN